VEIKSYEDKTQFLGHNTIVDYGEVRRIFLGKFNVQYNYPFQGAGRQS
jgi:hypothetical protein